jgi:signal recognition particle subunit SEC65
MLACKHYSRVGKPQLKELKEFVTKLQISQDQPELSYPNSEHVKLRVVYDPFKKMLKVSIVNKPGELSQRRIWSVIDAAIKETHEKF